MRIAILDPAAGISGDMTLGALLSLGVPVSWLEELPARLGIGDISVSVRDVRRAGITCRQVQFDIPEQPHGRHVGDLVQLVERAPISDWVKERAVRAFRLVGEAEGRVHGVAPEKVHLHEVGAVDALLDIVGAIEGFERLGVQALDHCPVAVGQGWVESAHGRLPVPAPATAILLEGLEVTSTGHVEGEATTPTGAALLRVLSAGAPPDRWRMVSSGWGAGQRDPKPYPNALRILLAETASEAGRVVLLATDVDDMSPEYVEPLRQALMSAGALDVQTWQVQMKKGRSGFRVEVMAPETLADAVTAELFRHSTTAGVRRWIAERATLPRHQLTVRLDGVAVRVEVLDGGAIRGKPKFEDQRKKDLADAQRVLTQAVTGDQDKNPAAWYYLGRYYVMTDDPQGVDSAFRHAEALKHECAVDIGLWRRYLWVPAFNAGIAAWQANHSDSAIASFRRSNALLPNEPTGFKYSAILFYNAGQSDSALFYFRRAADVAATDPKFASDRKDALYNLGRIQHSQQKLAEAQATYHEYLKIYPNDPEIMAALGSIYMQRSSKEPAYKDSAFTMYRQIVSKGDSMGYYQLYRVGAEISQSVPEDPDTSAAGASCRSAARAKRPPPPLARIRATCDSTSRAMAKAYFASSQEAFTLAAQALSAALRINPYYRETLIFLANTSLGLHDSVNSLAMSRRLLSVVPMNRPSINVMAYAQQQNHQIDSALYYYKIADSTLVGDVAITLFDSTDAGRDVKVMVTNTRERPNQPYNIVFEFLNLQGQVVATDTVKVAQAPPGQAQQFEVKPAGPSIAAWRYKKQ